jgi:hypothetical protein
MGDFLGRDWKRGVALYCLSFQSLSDPMVHPETLNSPIKKAKDIMGMGTDSSRSGFSLVHTENVDLLPENDRNLVFTMTDTYSSP